MPCWLQAERDDASALAYARHWSDLVGKLGGDDEAGRTMGALLSSLGARFASENAVAQVWLAPLLLCSDLAVLPGP